MHDDIDLPSDDTKALRVVALDAMRFLSEVDQRVRLVRRRNDPSRTLLVSEELVGKGNNHSLLQEGPVQEGPLADHLACELGRFDILECVFDGNHHRDVLAVLSVHVDCVMIELRVMRKRLHRGETSQGRSTKVNPVNEAGNELDAASKLR